MNKKIPGKCTLTDKELIEKCGWWVKKLCESRGKCWVLRIPVDSNHDPDEVFTELSKRFTEKENKSDKAVFMELLKIGSECNVSCSELLAFIESSTRGAEAGNKLRKILKTSGKEGVNDMLS